MHSPAEWNTLKSYLFEWAYVFLSVFEDDCCSLREGQLQSTSKQYQVLQGLLKSMGLEGCNSV